MNNRKDYKFNILISFHEKKTQYLVDDQVTLISLSLLQNQMTVQSTAS